MFTRPRQADLSRAARSSGEKGNGEIPRPPDRPGEDASFFPSPPPTRISVVSHLQTATRHQTPNNAGVVKGDDETSSGNRARIRAQPEPEFSCGSAPVNTTHFTG